jgi:hypothetical protein
MTWLSFLFVGAGAVLLLFGWKGDRERFKKTAIALVAVGAVLYFFT